MELTITNSENCIIVKVNDKRFTYYESASFKNTLSSLIDSGEHRIIIDLEEVEFMDSSGLGTLISLKASHNKKASGKGLFAVTCREGHVKHLFTITKADNFIQVFSDVKSAGESL